jgi:hypothetical protein
MTRRRLVSAGITTPPRPPRVILEWFRGGPPTIAAYIFPENEFVRGWWRDYSRDNPNAQTPIDGEWLLLGDR